MQVKQKVICTLQRMSYQPNYVTLFLLCNKLSELSLSFQHCPKVVHDLMLSCWSKDRIKRPTFGHIRETLEKWIRNPDLLQEIASVVTKKLV